MKNIRKQHQRAEFDRLRGDRESLVLKYNAALEKVQRAQKALHIKQAMQKELDVYPGYAAEEEGQCRELERQIETEQPIVDQLATRKQQLQAELKRVDGLQQGIISELKTENCSRSNTGGAVGCVYSAICKRIATSSRRTSESGIISCRMRRKIFTTVAIGCSIVRN